MDRSEFKEAYGKLVAKAREDEAFKAELLSDATKVFKENGIRVPDGMEVCMVENTPDKMYFILPPERDDALTEEEMDAVAGGSAFNTLMDILEQCGLAAYEFLKVS